MRALSVQEPAFKPGRIAKIQIVNIRASEGAVAESRAAKRVDDSKTDGICVLLPGAFLRLFMRVAKLKTSPRTSTSTPVATPIKWPGAVELAAIAVSNVPFASKDTDATTDPPPTASPKPAIARRRESVPIGAFGPRFSETIAVVTRARTAITSPVTLSFEPVIPGRRVGFGYSHW